MSESADAPLDDSDAAILAELAAAYSLADPPPADLDERVRFAIALGDIDAEVARLAGGRPPRAPPRAESRPGGGRHATHAVTADDTGRFVVDDVPLGLAQLI